MTKKVMLLKTNQIRAWIDYDDYDDDGDYEDGDVVDEKDEDDNDRYSWVGVMVSRKVFSWKIPLQKAYPVYQQASYYN